MSALGQKPPWGHAPAGRGARAFPVANHGEASRRRWRWRRLRLGCVRIRGFWIGGWIPKLRAGCPSHPVGTHSARSYATGTPAQRAPRDYRGTRRRAGRRRSQ